MDEPNPPYSEEVLDRLRVELVELTSDAVRQGAKYQRRARAWLEIDLMVGLSTAILTALAGATGLASTAGRIPAAIMALCAAALTAAVRFLQCSERYEKNRRLCIAWRVLEQEARFASAADGHPKAQNLYDAVQDLLKRRAVAMEMYHFPLPDDIIPKHSRRLPRTQRKSRIDPGERGWETGS
jgi:hypothetical protein